MARDTERELEVVIRFKAITGDYEYNRETEHHRIEEAAKELAQNLKKYGYQFHDIKRYNKGDDNEKMKRSFIIVLNSRQSPEELKRRLDSMHTSSAWTYCEVF